MLTAVEAPSAGGAAFDEVLVAGAMATAILAATAYVVLRERLGHRTVVGRLADRAAEKEGLPRWASLPSHLLFVSVVCAGWGVWWDVPIHMQNGRDEGPLANPSHYAIFIGLLGIMSSGLISMGLARDPLPRRAFRLSRTWHVPMGSLVVFAAGAIAVLGFPADDLWHRLFGQDVTEWGPTHVMMIGGAVTSVIGLPLLLAEARQVGARGAQGLAGRLRGAWWIGTCSVVFAFLMEFELGLPQFPAVTEFIISGFIMGWVFVAARVWFGPGGALVACAFYLTARVVLWAGQAVLPEVLTGGFLLYLPSALLVEAVALLIAPQRRPLGFVLASGLAIGVPGLLFEWWWSGVNMPLPHRFPADTLPWMIGTGTAAALGGGLVGVWMASRLQLVSGEDQAAAHDPHRLSRRGVGLAGLAVFVVLMGLFAPPTSGDREIRGTVEFTDVTFADGTTADECDGEGVCNARVTVRIEPADAVEDAVWFYAFGWQGRGPGAEVNPDAEAEPGSDAGGVVRYAMEPTGEPGVYTSARPLPLHGTWKMMVRMHFAPTTMLTFPLHFPDDPAITSARGRQILALDGDTITARYEPHLLQRETKDDVPRWLWTAGYSLVIAMWLALLLFYGWCYNRAARGVARRDTGPAPAPTPSRQLT